ncbi:MAG: restriction endonuclease subunit S, partial [Nitrospira sp. SB0667_bin_9]|nr:restriction endonuclease subunit S [Nitrospira sp. SB0667_bin_9]
MIAAQLLTHFDRLADAPDAIPRLRRFILDLAVRGRLVPQDPNDEPASELLKRIAAEKKRMVEAGKVRKPKMLILVNETEIPFMLPTNWRWSQIAEIGLLSPRNETTDDTLASFVPMPMIAADYGEASNHEVRRWGDIKGGYTHFAEGDVGLAKITPCFQNGKSTVFRDLTGGVGSGTTELHVVRPLFVNPNFVLLFLKCPYFIETGIPIMTGTAGQKRVPTEYFAYSPFPLPPLAEQHRIVAKADELMALCDRLEATQAERETTRNRMATASLARLNAPDPDPATFQIHIAFAFNNFTPLTTRPDQIKALRQAILNLAVRGKLVAQNPNDEPASELLRRRKIVVQGAGPFDLPGSWTWVNVGEVADSRLGKMLDKAKNKGMPREYLRNINVRWFDFDLSDVLEMRFEDSELPEFALRFGDVLICEGGEPGRAAVWDDRRPDIYFQKAIHRVRFQDFVDSKFFVKALRASADDGHLSEYFTGTGIKHFTGKGLAAYLFPLPPLAEQHRIVAKVDELMAVCDRLEEGLTTNTNTQRCLLDSFLHHVLYLN